MFDRPLYPIRSQRGSAPPTLTRASSPPAAIEVRSPLQSANQGLQLRQILVQKLFTIGLGHLLSELFPLEHEHDIVFKDLTKTQHAYVIHLGPATIELFRTWRKLQNAEKHTFGSAYQNHGLVFASRTAAPTIPNDSAASSSASNSNTTLPPGLRTSYHDSPSTDSATSGPLSPSPRTSRQGRQRAPQPLHHQHHRRGL